MCAISVMTRGTTRRQSQGQYIHTYISILLDLGRILSADHKDDAAVSYNIKKASNAWFGMYRILSADGANAHVMARFYLAIIQAKLLFGSETWVLSQKALGRLEQFHARCARYITQ